LPIFSVSKPNKPTNIHLVQDAAAKFNGMSLNDHLLRGPDNLTPLLGALLRSRERKIAICGDISEMFHQVKLAAADQFCQLVLWRNMDNSRTSSTFK
jgi:hypothetical protein